MRKKEERLVVLVVSARVCCVYVLATYISWASYRQGSLSSIDRSAGGGEQQQQQQQQPTEPITNAISERTFIGLTAPSPPIDDFSAICLQRR